VTLTLLGGLECLLGVFVLLWPGAWQEALHPLAMGSVFYPLQAMAAGWILRGGLTIAAARRPNRWVAGAWLIEVPMSAIFLIRAGLLGPWAALAHGARLVMAISALVLLGRPAAADMDSTAA
jgi:hypothetical protein